MNKIIKTLKMLFINIFLPEMCIGCEREGETICRQCQSEIKSFKNHKKYYGEIDWLISPLLYENEKVRKAFFFLKYHHTRSVAKYLAKIVEKDFLDFLLENNIQKENSDIASNVAANIIFIPIPISKKRLTERDYNQSELILREILSCLKETEQNRNKYSLDLENNIYTDLLIKIKHTVKFANTHKRSEREELIRDAFTINEIYKRDFLENKIIILLDDIITTGATFYEARKTLINNGAKKENIFGFAVAH